MKPIFILSLPRSGSTLLQKMLAAHTHIATVAEPWIMLPLASMTGECSGRTYADYSSRLARKAVLELCQGLPGGMNRYREHLRRFVAGLYEELCAGDEVYFVDKTPRYYLIVDFLVELFPDAKLIFLFRHPLDVLSSVVTTFSRGRFATHHAHVDLFQGPIRLHEAHQRYADRSVTIHYEQLVAAPEESCIRLLRYLDLEYESAMVTGYGRVAFEGSMGDKVGETKYTGVDSGSVARWKGILAPRVRRRFARQYVRWLGKDVLATFGVDFEVVQEEIRSNRPVERSILRDLFWLSSSWIARRMAWNVLRRQWSLEDSVIHKLD